jgi:hypothetical protein
MIAAMIRPWLTCALVVIACGFSASPVQGVDVSVPSSPPNNTTVVNGNFLGVSFELSAFDKYCEFDPSSRSVVRDRELTCESLRGRW